MTVKQLKEVLDAFPDDMPVATCNDISFENKDNPYWITAQITTWTDSNYPYSKPDFEYVNLM